MLNMILMLNVHVCMILSHGHRLAVMYQIGCRTLFTEVSCSVAILQLFFGAKGYIN